MAQLRAALLLGSALVLAFSGRGNPAAADSFLIDALVNATNGGFIIDDDDTLTVTETGVIDVNGVDGVFFSMGNNSRLDLLGSIVTQGVKADGIYLNSGANHTVVVSGSVVTGGAIARGIFLHQGVNHNLDVSGSVTTTGPVSQGIMVNLGADHDVNVSGSVVTEDSISPGIQLNYGLGNDLSVSGSIMTKGSSSKAVLLSNGIGHTVDISGNIHTLMSSADGIVLSQGAGHTVDFSGSIEIEGSAAHGISVFLGEHHRIAASGSVFTREVAANGMEFNGGNNHSASMSGSIQTLGVDASGIYIGNGSNHSVKASGSIITHGVSSRGIFVFLGNNHAIDFSGSIDTHEIGASGISLNGGDNHAVMVGGTVHTRGTGADGILLNGGSNHTVTVCGGRIIAENQHAIHVTVPGGGHTLNLCTSSFIYSKESPIDLQDSVFNISLVPASSVLWNLQNTTSTPSVTGPGAWYFDPVTDQFATFDNTGLVAGANWIADLTGQLSNLISRRTTGAGSGAHRGGGASASLNAVSHMMVQDRAATVMPAASGEPSRAFSPFGLADGGMTAWAAGFGAMQDYKQDGAALAHRVHDWGFAFGGDMAVDDTLSVGFMGGYVNAAAEADGKWSRSQDNEAQGGFGAIYGRKDFFHGLFAGFGLIGGGLAHDDERFINTSDANMGSSRAHADYGSWFLSPGVRLGADIEAPAAGVVLTPSGQFRYTAQWVDGYTESGNSGANAKVGSRTVSLGEVSGELAMSTDFDFGAMWTGRLTGRAGYVHRFNLGDNDAGVTVIGIDQPVAAGASDLGWAYAGGGAVWRLTRQLELEVNADATFGNDLSDTGVAGSATIGWSL